MKQTGGNGLREKEKKRKNALFLLTETQKQDMT